jgi:hypothetical protein
VLDERTGAVAVPLSQLLGPLRLDPLGVADDAGFVERLLAQANIPPPVRATLRTLHR